MTNETVGDPKEVQHRYKKSDYCELSRSLYGNQE